MEKKCCGTCEWHQKEDYTVKHPYCDNCYSDSWLEFTDEHHVCAEWMAQIKK